MLYGFMKTLNNPLSDRSIEDWDKIADLAYYDGELTMIFRLKHDGSIWYCSWVDCDELANRWMMFKTSNEALNEMLSGKVSIRNFYLHDAQDVLFVDVTINNKRLFFGSREIPGDYLPESGVTW